jgi:hypothetical protein
MLGLRGVLEADRIKYVHVAWGNTVDYLVPVDEWSCDVDGSEWY